VALRLLFLAAGRQAGDAALHQGQVDAAHAGTFAGAQDIGYAGVLPWIDAHRVMLQRAAQRQRQFSVGQQAIAACQVVALDALAALAGFPGRIAATVLGARSQSVFDVDLSGPTAWLFGAEGRGLSAPLQALADTQVHIPMPGRIESLNVAAAAAICLFEQVRQQRDS